MTPRSVPKRPKMLPRRLQDGLEAVFFSHRFLSSMLVRFGSDFGAILEPFWEPKSVILGIDFWMIFHVVPGSPQERPKSGQEPPKRGPRAPKSPPREAQERPRTSQECPKSGQEAPKSGKKGPKTAPRGPKGQRKDNEGRASEASGRKESEKITRAVQAKQAAETRAKR